MGFRVDDGGVQKFADGKGVHPIGEVTSHQAVTTSLVDVEACAACDDDSGFPTVSVKEPRGISFMVGSVSNFGRQRQYHSVCCYGLVYTIP